MTAALASGAQGAGREAQGAAARPAPNAQRPAPDSTVTIDVKDEDAHAILRDMQKQCAVKNLLIDDDVNARGTFKLRNVPCPTAFKVVFRSLGLAATDYGNSVVTVGRDRR